MPAVPVCIWTVSVIQVASGAIGSNGSVFTWGRNTFHRLGHPVGEDHQEPLPREVKIELEPNCKPTDLFIGMTHAALLFDGGH